VKPRVNATGRASFVAAERSAHPVPAVLALLRAWPLRPGEHRWLGSAPELDGLCVPLY